MRRSTWFFNALSLSSCSNLKILMMQKCNLMFARLAYVLLHIVTGCDCGLTLTPIGPTNIRAFVGTNVTVGVSYSGVTAPLVTWKNGSIIMVIWTVGSNSPPEIDPKLKGVLSVDPTGSLVFWNILVSYSSTYTVQMTKPGTQEVSVNFTLLVYDAITDVSMTAEGQEAIEGRPLFTLSCNSAPGVATASSWFFNGNEVADGTRYSVTVKSLTIQRPNRNDTGLYVVNLTNPFSSGTQNKSIAVLYGPDQPILEVTPTKGTFVTGETLSLSCRAEGEPVPSATWFYKGQALPTSSVGMLKLADVQTSQSGIYTCKLHNNKTNAQLERNVTIDIRGLSASAIAGISAGIPCAILLLLLLVALITLCICCYKKKDRNPRYPVPRTVEKAIISQSDLSKPHKLLTKGLKIPPDYQHHQVPSERSGSLPLQMTPVRMATTV